MMIFTTLMIFRKLLLFIDNSNHNHIHAKNRTGPILAWVILAHFILRLKHPRSSKSQCAIVFRRHVIVLAMTFVNYAGYSKANFQDSVQNNQGYTAR